jgi:hypothetical protein
MLNENEIIRALCLHLQATDHIIEQHCDAGVHGIDLIARTKDGGKRLLIEVKGGTSTRPDSSRYNKPYTSSQVFDVVAKGFHQILQRHLDFSSDCRHDFGFAFPDHPVFHKYVSPIVPVAKMMKIRLFAVNDKGIVSELI